MGFEEKAGKQRRRKLKNGRKRTKKKKSEDGWVRKEKRSKLEN